MSLKLLARIWIVAIFLQLVQISEAQELEHTQIVSQYLSTQVSDAYVFSSEEEMGILLFGKLPGQEKATRLGKISTLYSDDETWINIEEVNTEENARGLGVATVLYEHVIRSKESKIGKKVTHLAGTAKVGTNRDVILNSFIAALRSKSGFIEPNSAADLESQFHECCSKIYSSYPELLLEAIDHSPTAKIGKTLGFEIDPLSVEFSLNHFEGKPHVHVNYVQLKK